MSSAHTPSAPFGALLQLQQRIGLDLPNIEAARRFTLDVRDQLQAALRDACPKNCSLVLCGSLGRFELTRGSDIDWELLIDGPVEASHRTDAAAIEQTVNAVRAKAGLVDPSAAGPFAGNVFSHDLVHTIGGEGDTNRNMTRRMLLLLEACAMSQPLVLKRVITAILARYLDQDQQVYKEPRDGNYFPRFLMNDVVRFWRTMAVDFASKFDARAGKKWALRNAKLRFSRKLLFVAGVLLAYEAVLEPKDDSLHAQLKPGFELIERIQRVTTLPPLEVLARALLRFQDWPELDQTAATILRSYDAFIGIIADDAKRKELQNVSAEQAAQSAVFQEIRKISGDFEGGLIDFFFRGPRSISNLSNAYSFF